MLRCKLRLFAVRITTHHSNLSITNMCKFFYAFRRWLSLSLVFVFRLELFALSQPDISFSSVLDILDLVQLYYIVLHWTRGISESSNV